MRMRRRFPHLTTQMRLFLAILSTSLLLIAFLLFGIRAFFLHNFADYQTAQERQRLSQVAVILADYYQQSDTVEGLSSLFVWQRALRAVQRDLLLQPNRFGFDDQLAFRELSLFTETGERVFGPAIENPLTVPVLVEGESTGLLSAPRPAIALGPIEEVFQAQQGTAFLYAGLIAVFLAALSAGWISLGLRRRLQRLATISRRLAKGDYTIVRQTGSEAPAHDPVEILAQDMYTLAQTLNINREQRQQLLADIAHELRTPLTILQGDLEAVQDGIRSADDAHQERVYQQVIQLVRLTQDLHQLAQSDSGALSFQFEEANLDALTKRVLSAVQPRAEANDLRIDYKQQGHPKNWCCDAGRIEQSLLNLLENSVRYTHAPGQIECVLHYTDNTVCWRISDSAPGLSVAQQQRLGERLYRPDSARSRDHGGSGLGLAIVRSIVKAHGGTLAFSDSILGGLEVELCLPRRDGQE